MKIGSNLRRIRLIKGIKQDAMSELLGISQAAYSKMENDETDISLSRLTQIAEKLDCKEEDILNFDEKYVFNNCTNTGVNQPTYNLSSLERTFFEELLKSKDKLLKAQSEIINTKEILIENLREKLNLNADKK